MIGRPNDIEIFHLLFLRFLEQKVPKQYYALKGGCNLRFFFRSIRFSEDIDLDAWTIEPHVLEARVNQVLKSEPFNEALTAQRLQMLNLRQHKQTDTTQRWKMAIRPLAGGPERPTKIEFSRRSKCAPGSAPVELIDTEIVNRYRLHPILLPHYPLALAIEQKFRALLDRRETQARDVFDLDLLFGQAAPAQLNFSSFSKERSQIEEKILSIDFEVFHSQVVAYLEPQYQEHYSKPACWEELQLRLLERLRSP